MTGNQKYCPACGAANPQEVAYCISCGSKFPQMASQPAPANPQPVQPPAAAYPQPGTPVNFPAIPQAYPTAGRSDFITLSCPNCGGRLQITPDIERFACQYCGYEHIVRRNGGMVSLEPVVRVMQNINSNINLVGMGVNMLGFSSEKQVAEQAIARIKTEIPELEARVNALQESSGCSVTAGIMGIVFGVILFIVAIFTKGWVAIFGLLSLILGIIFLATSNQTREKAALMEAKQRLDAKKQELERCYQIVRR
jgi:ribosomal protein S27AE